MSKNIMNATGQIGHGSGSPITGGVFVITATPSAKTSAPTGQGVYRGPLTYTFSGGSAAGFDPGTIATTVPQTINPTAIKASADGFKFIREDDNGIMAATGTVSGTPTPITGSVEVISAGQTKARAK